MAGIEREQLRVMAGELEVMRERAEHAEARLASIAGATRERLARDAYEEGFMAGYVFDPKGVPAPRIPCTPNEEMEAGLMRFLRTRAEEMGVTSATAWRTDSLSVPNERSHEP